MPLLALEILSKAANQILLPWWHWKRILCIPAKPIALEYESVERTETEATIKSGFSIRGKRYWIKAKLHLYRAGGGLQLYPNGRIQTIHTPAGPDWKMEQVIPRGDEISTRLKFTRISDNSDQWDDPAHKAFSIGRVTVHSY